MSNRHTDMEDTMALRVPKAALNAEQKAVEADRKSIAAESAELKVSLERIAGERKTTVSGITPHVLAVLE